MGSDSFELSRHVLEEAVGAGFAEPGSRDDTQAFNDAGDLYMTREKWTRKFVVELVAEHQKEAAAEVAAKQAELEPAAA